MIRENVFALKNLTPSSRFMIHSNLGKNISGVINAYHAEKHLPQVEDSMKHFDEIIVCDMETSTMSYTVQL